MLIIFILLLWELSRLIYFIFFAIFPLSVSDGLEFESELMDSIKDFRE